MNLAWCARRFVVHARKPVMNAPKHSFACAGFHATSLSRRDLLKVGGLGLLGLTVPKLLRAEEAKKGPPARAKSVIFLYQFGGPSHIDMFDMKPEAPEAIRGSHKPVASKADGIAISEHLPRLAKVMDKVTLIRSMHHRMNNHNPASYYALTGHAPPVDDITLRDSPELFPGYGSVVDQLAPVGGAMPTAVSLPHVIGDGTITPGQSASFLGKQHDPLLITRDPNKPDFNLPELTLPANLSFERLMHRREIQKMIDQQSRLLSYSAQVRGFDAYYEGVAMSLLGCGFVCPPVRQRPGALWPHDLRAELPARAPICRGGHEVRDGLFCAKHRRRCRKRLGYSRQQRQKDVPNHGEVSFADDRPDVAHVAGGPGSTRIARHHAGRLDGRIWTHAEDQQRGQPRSLAAVLHRSPRRGRSETGIRLWRFRQNGVPSDRESRAPG